MRDKKIYKLLAIFAFTIAAVFTWFDPTKAITGILIAIYATLWAILVLAAAER